MTKPKILSQKPVTMSEVKSEIEAIKKRDTELNFRSQRTEEYLNVFAKLSKTKAEELRKKLDNLGVPRLGEDHIVKIIDTLPKNTDELKVILQGYPLTITKDNTEKIVKAVQEFL
ncbi:hypothetical protein KY311_04160 [Candidatus Woesearchaeota archaeon]|nr:hypothetical protein [Candidatus Woesearchaeota archaeon]MBW3017080.1 hypothetical protein [Candidatus Woesearchaeota archaeon]